MEPAVIDRFEGKLAVLLVGKQERRLDVSRGQLPRGAREGDWLQVELAGDQLMQARLDPDATEKARQRIEEKLERLRRGEHLS